MGPGWSFGEQYPVILNEAQRDSYVYQNKSVVSLKSLLPLQMIEDVDRKQHAQKDIAKLPLNLEFGWVVRPHISNAPLYVSMTTSKTTYFGRKTNLWCSTMAKSLKIHN